MSHSVMNQSLLNRNRRIYSVIAAFIITVTVYFSRPERTTGPQIPVQPVNRQQCDLKNIVSQGQKVAVSRTKTLLISAYQEHRTGREVRVLAVVLRSETVAYRCHLCCQNQLQTSEGSINIHSDHFGFAYGTADIMCRVPSGYKLEFLEVKNLVKSESFPYSFTVCISTMFDFTNVLQLVQSLEMLQILGVNRVVIYKTNSSPEIERILDYYIRTGLVEIHVSVQICGPA